MTSWFSCFGWKNDTWSSDRPTTWSEQDHQRYPEWLREIIEYNDKAPLELHPTVRDLKDHIENNTHIKLLVCGMCDELTLRGAHKPLSANVNILQSYEDLVKVFNYMVRVPPLWNTHMYMIGMESAPYYLVLHEAMHTECGFALFLDKEVNVLIGRILNAWRDFLLTPESASCLDKSSSGWFNPKSIAHLADEANLDDNHRSFEDIYICDATKQHFGFKSWDDYFTRQFRPGVRPLAAPGDDSVFTAVCESRPWRISYDVKYEDKFWAKGAAYSLKDMLDEDQHSRKFIGGTVYQAYLSAIAYHRWHSPVNGKIVRAFNVPGTYFSEPLHQGFGPGTADKRMDVNWMQAYLTAVATRAVIFIEADNPDIGLMAVILIGMGEVSSCDITVREGQTIQKGEQIGSFHFGGSTHCVLFRPGVEVMDLPNPKQTKKNVAVRSKLGRVAPKKSLSVLNPPRESLL